jgi:glucokinase
MGRSDINLNSFLNELERFVNKLGENFPFSYFVAVDVGATNTRLVLLLRTQNEEETIVEMSKFECRDMNFLVDTLTRISKEVVQILKQEATSAALSLAGPIAIDNNSVKITNYEEGKQELLKSRLPTPLFPTGKTHFLNDLEACCYGLISEGIKGNLGSYFVPAFEKKTEVNRNLQLKDQAYAVLAMGTGLGCGLILCKKTNEKLTFYPLPLEAGHVLVAAEGKASRNYEKEQKRFEYISKIVWESKFTIEYEDICSGRGLQRCYNFELEYANKKAGKDLSPAEIAQSYEQDECAHDAMEAHYSYLMKAAQNICVMIPSCKGVFFAGDNQVHNEKFFNENVKKLKEVFLYHPKRSWLEPVEAFRQIEERNFNVVGCHYCAQLISQGMHS